MTHLRWFRDPPRTRSACPPGEALLVYDDGCGFCSRWACWIERRTGSDFRLVGFSRYDVVSGYLQDVPPDVFEASAHFVSPTGVEYHGGEAVTQALRAWRWGWLVRPLDWPGLSALRAAGYRLVARNRSRMPPWLAPRCSGN